MLKVWIAGAGGQIGRALNDVLDPMQIEALNTDVDELDITDTDEVINFGTVNRPDVIINCTGITDTDECEENPEHAYRVNALGARNLSIVARKCGSKIVQLSTDDVFDGQSKKPYTEFDDTNPLTVYGRSKRAGENYVKEFTHKHFVIRSNWVYGHGAKDLARMILYLISTNEYGTYHVTCSGICNRYEFAQEILRLAGKTIELKAVPTEQSDLSSVRPPYAVLDNFILRIIEMYDMPEWKESLKEYMDERTEG